MEAVKLIGTAALVAANEDILGDPAARISPDVAAALHPKGPHVIALVTPSPGASVARCCVWARLAASEAPLIVWADLPAKFVESLATCDGESVVGEKGAGCKLVGWTAAESKPKPAKPEKGSEAK